MSGTFVISVGFLLGPVIVARHFPKDEAASNSKERVCKKMLWHEQPGIETSTRYIG